MTETIIIIIISKLIRRKYEHPTQTLLFTKTAGHHNLVEVIVI